MSYKERVRAALERLGIAENNHGLHNGHASVPTHGGKTIESHSPVDGELIAKIELGDANDLEKVLDTAEPAFKAWRSWPAPQRGEIVRQIGLKLRAHKEDLGLLVSYEMGKIHQEGMGEVQEIIDICDFATGLSRQLYGMTTKSERPDHRMYEQWQPLGPVGVISAFNFPVAVWGWNAMVAAVCGDSVVWKPSEKSPLSALGCMKLMEEVLKENDVPAGVFNLIVGDREVGEGMAKTDRLPLVSATGSIPMGRSVGQNVMERLGRPLLELGGNNAIIVTPNADMQLALQATVFAAAGTSGQRCTTARRLILHKDVYDKFTESLTKTYVSLQERIGNPLEEGKLVGPLIDAEAVEAMQQTLKEVQAEGGKILAGGQTVQVPGLENGHYVQPTLVEAQPNYDSVQRETFAPILYVLKYDTIEEAIAIQNGVPQGLSSSIFSNNLREVETFLSEAGSDCGIANVNIGPSGAEIGGAFGGEKETGGGRESGSDAWKAYMRRQTVTINYSTDLPLAQGIKFDI